MKKYFDDFAARRANVEQQVKTFFYKLQRHCSTLIIDLPALLIVLAVSI